MAYAGNPKRVLIIVENLPVPFDRRVWQEAVTLQHAGYTVSVICPKGNGYDQSYERLDGIDIYRHRLPLEGRGAIGYLLEYSIALAAQLYLTLKISFKGGFDVIHACNPPDTIFIVAGIFKVFGKKFLFDHHDINPELYVAKFGRQDALYKLLLFLERMTFKMADVCISTNESYKSIAVTRGGKNPENVYVVRSGPNLERLKMGPAQPDLKMGRKYLVGYVGVMGAQEGIDLLLQAIHYITHDLGRQDIHFGLIGGGTELSRMRQYATELAVSDFVTFTGRVSDEKMLAMLNTAEVCVNPDLANEMNDKSTMNKVMEYMALEKPLVQFDLTEGRFSAQEASLYARKNDFKDLGDKIVSLLDDAEARERMGKFGRARVENELEWKYEAPRLLAAYEALFSAPQGQDGCRPETPDPDHGCEKI